MYTVEWISGGSKFAHPLTLRLLLPTQDTYMIVDEVFCQPHCIHSN